MTPEEFHKKYSIQDISSYIHELDYLADHENDEYSAQFLRDLYDMFVSIFPDCDPYKEN